MLSKIKKMEMQKIFVDKRSLQQVKKRMEAGKF
jgi:hypothetical protein